MWVSHKHQSLINQTKFTFALAKFTTLSEGLVKEQKRAIRKEDNRIIGVDMRSVNGSGKRTR